MKIFLFSLFLFTSLPQLAENSGTLRIAVASNFITTARQLVVAYELQQQHQKIVLSSGSTGKLTTQIRYGAPFDLFLSADLAHPQKLITQRLAEADSLQAYAIGELVLISRMTLKSPKQLETINQALQIAIANPNIAPYGVAAKNWLDATLQHKHLHQVVMGENINQTWHYFVNGGADIALVALSQIKSQEEVEFKHWRLTSTGTQLKQFAVMLSATKNSDAARQFLEFLKTSNARSIIESAGYRLPEISH